MTANKGAQPSPLALEILNATFAMSRETSTTLIDSLTEQLATSQAEVIAIRTGVLDLLDGDFAPSDAVIRRALFPSNAKVDSFREAGAS